MLPAFFFEALDNNSRLEFCSISSLKVASAKYDSRAFSS